MPSNYELHIKFPVDDAMLSDLHARASSYPSAAGPVAVQPWRARLERHSITWVGAFDGEDLVGFVNACWDGGLHAFLLDLVVGPAHRHQGLASRLVLVLVDEVWRAGCEWLHVDFEAHLDLFYRAVGFRHTSAGLINVNCRPPD